MKRMLQKQKAGLYYYEQGIRRIGVHSKITGDISGLRGDITGLTGDISAGLRGDISGLRGDITLNIEGNIDLCEITEKERQQGVNIEDLIQKD